jgi:hypothetical protein
VFPYPEYVGTTPYQDNPTIHQLGTPQPATRVNQKKKKKKIPQLPREEAF